MVGYSWFEFRAFLLDWLPNQGWKYRLPYYLPLDGLMYFSRALALSDMQTTSSRIWTQVTDFISYDDNCYSGCAFILCKFLLLISLSLSLSLLAQLAWAAEYTDCIFAERENSTNKRPGYDTKQSDGKAPIMLALWKNVEYSLMPSLPGPLWLGVVAPDRVLSMCQNEN